MAESTVPIEAELTLFRSKLNKVRRRTAERYRCALASAGKLFFPGTGETMTAWLNNLSVTGIGLNLPRSLDAGLQRRYTLAHLLERSRLFKVSRLH